MKNLLPFLFILLISCKGMGGKDANTIEREGEPDIVNVESSDVAMNTAIAKAQSTLGDFESALKDPKAGQEDFSLKYRFDTDDGGGEHMWLNTITFNDGKYTGILNNVPEYVSNVKLGDTITVDNKNISDWMYLDNKKLIGGYTIRVLVDNMPPDERKAFLEGSDMIIE